jgi:hypothetical protein
MTVSQLEENIYELPLNDQLCLMERLAQHIRNEMSESQELEKQISAMANDPQIQRELRVIETEFSITELDGLK